MSLVDLLQEKIYIGKYSEAELRIVSRRMERLATWGFRLGLS
jgi:hypothetical protein